MAIGGRLQYFAETWARTISDAWALETVSSGYSLEFTRTQGSFHRNSQKPILRQTQCNSSSNTTPARDQCDRAGTQRVLGDRSVLRVLHSTEEEWGRKSHTRSQMAEWVYQKEEVQDGNTEIYSGDDTERRFYGLSRSVRSLSPHTHLAGPSKVSQICIRWESLPIQSFTLRPEIFAESVFQGTSDIGGTSAVTGRGSVSISGRHLDSGTFPTGRDRSGTSHGGLSAESRICDKLGEEYLNSIPIHSPSGSPYRYTFGQSSDIVRADSKDPESSGGGPSAVRGGTLGSGKIIGHDGLLPGDCRMVQIPLENPPEISQTVPERNHEKDEYASVANKNSERQSTVVADPYTFHSGSAAQRTKQGCGHYGCQFIRVGGTYGSTNDPGCLDPPRGDQQHQFAGAESYQTGAEELPTLSTRSTCSCPNGQHDGESVHQSPGRSQNPHAEQGSGRDHVLVGDQHSISEGCTRSRSIQHLGRPTEQRAGGSQRVVPEQGRVQVDMHQIWDASGGPVRNCPQSTGTEILLQMQRTGGDGDGRVELPVATSSSLCLSTPSATVKSRTKNDTTKGGITAGGSTLATQTVVSGLAEVIHTGTLASTSEDRPAPAGGHRSSKSRDTKVDYLEIERQRLLKAGYGESVVNTMLASRKESTHKIYNQTWQRFVTWCAEQHRDPLKPPVSLILGFLQAGVDKGLSVCTLRRHVAAISAVLGRGKNRSLAQHSHVKRFLRGVSLVSPPQVHRFPSWRLNLVLRALCHPPFESMASCQVKILTIKTLFLIALVSARRVSELRALSVHKDLCIFQKDSVVLRLDPAFVPKVNSQFHRSQDIVLPSFCPDPKSSKERVLHCLDVRRALSFYLDRTRDSRRSESLFVSFRNPSVGKPVSASTLSRWIRECIAMAYKASGVEVPSGICAHSLRSASTSAAYRSFPSLETVCKAATWSSVHTFTKHYRVDKRASAEAAFGRVVLQQVLAD